MMSGEDIPSPCIRNCCLDEHEICLGCGRSLDEIRDWGGAPPAVRRQILERATHRRAEREAMLRSLRPPRRPL